MTVATVLSVNAATAGELLVGEESRRTGILKAPRAGPVWVTAEGIEGDFIGNRRVHGGPDQALYLYSAEDAAYWSAELGRPCPPGFFGENLSLDRWWPEPRIGDRLALGTLLIELSFPRIPCATLAARAGDPGFVKRFAAAGRPGAYARVLAPGELAAGGRLDVQPAPADYPLVTALFHAWLDRARHQEVLRDGLRAPLASRWRLAFERELASAPSA